MHAGKVLIRRSRGFVIGGRVFHHSDGEPVDKFDNGNQAESHKESHDAPNLADKIAKVHPRLSHKFKGWRGLEVKRDLSDVLFVGVVHVVHTVNRFKDNVFLVRIRRRVRSFVGPDASQVCLTMIGKCSKRKTIFKSFSTKKNHAKSAYYPQNCT